LWFIAIAEEKLVEVIESEELYSGASPLRIVSIKWPKGQPVLLTGTSDNAASDRTRKK